MSKYRHLGSWDKLIELISENNNNKPAKLTDMIDFLLLEGGSIKNIHNIIKKEQQNRNSKGYTQHGYLFDKKGNIQQRTLFGHIANLAINEGMIIKLGEYEISKKLSKNKIEELYNNDEFIQLVGLNGKVNTQQKNNLWPKNLYPDEVDNRKKYTEGSTTTVTVNKYERDKRARDKCINHYGANCVVCNFNFEKKYGEIGVNFIHVHHKIPLSQIKKTYKVDPIQDLIPVCPNCHAMLHCKTPPITIQELKDKIAQQGAQARRSGLRPAAS